VTGMISRDAIYEELRERISASAPASSADSRDVEWTSSSQTLGFARSSSGAIEVFLVGEPLQATRPGVARHLEHHQWTTVDGGSLSATRLLLPNEPHFDRVAAFICAELQLNDVDHSVPTAFSRSEEIIDLALTGASVDAEALLGLCGELLFLDALTRADSGAAARILMQSWRDTGRRVGTYNSARSVWKSRRPPGARLNITFKDPTRSNSGSL